MKREIPTWVWGCGVGCGALVLLCVAGVVGLGLFIRSTTSGFGEAVESRRELESRFGEADEFSPWADGAIPRERMEAFVEVRRATMAERRRIAETFDALPTSPEEAKEIERLNGWEQLTKGLSIAREAFGLAGRIGDFFKARNKALLEAEMGMAEYTFLYVIAYNSWLKHPPNEGLASKAGGVTIKTGQLKSRIRDRMLTMMQRQWESAPPGAWKDRLAAELESMRADEGRVPWSEELPQRIAASLEPFRQPLEETYNPVTNEFELGLNRSRGWSHTVE